MGLKGMKKKRVARNSISILLNNTFYMGIIEVKGETFNGKHKPLISPALFKRVQSILRGNTNQKVSKHDFKLKKLISCQHCGFSLTGETQKGHVYYRCHTKGCITKAVREMIIEDYLQKVFATTELYAEESLILEKLLCNTEHEWMEKQAGLLNSIKLQQAQLNHKVDRLTDCYLEGDLDKETFERRKENLLIEIKVVEANKEKIQLENATILKQVRKFFELAKSLKNSYKMAFSEEQRELVEIVTSNLQVSGKNLTITMRTPFLELYQRHIFNSGVPERDALRTEHTKVVYSDINTSPIIGKPLSEDQLKLLLDVIIQCVIPLAETNNNKIYDIQTYNPGA